MIIKNKKTDFLDIKYVDDIKYKRIYTIYDVMSSRLNKGLITTKEYYDWYYETEG